MFCGNTLDVKMQGCLRNDELTFKAALEGLDYTIEEEAIWASEMVMELYPTCQDVHTLLLTKLCSDGDVGLALGSLQMYYDPMQGMPQLFTSLLVRLLSVPGEMIFHASSHKQGIPARTDFLNVVKCLWISRHS